MLKVIARQLGVLAMLVGCLDLVSVAKLFFPEDQPMALVKPLREFWMA